MRTLRFIHFLISFLFVPFIVNGFSTIDSLQKIIISIDSLEEHHLYINTTIEVGNALLDAAKYPEATSHFKRAISLAKRFKLADERYLAELRLSRTYERQAKFKLASDLTEKMLGRIPNNDLSKRGEILRIFGSANVYQGDFESAYKAQIEALDIYITLKDSLSLEKVYYGLGSNFFYQNQTELAQKNYQKALDISYKLNLTYEIANCLNALGSIASSEEDFDTALDLNEKALEVFIDVDDQPSIAWTTYNIGTILHALGRNDEGLHKLKECKVLCDSINEVALQGYVLSSMGFIYSEKNEFRKAINCFNESYKIAEEDNDKSSIIELLEGFGDVYYLKKDLEMYKSYQDKYNAMKDSIYNQDLITSISDLKKDFEIKQIQKEKEIEYLKSEKQLQELSLKNRLWGGIAIIILFFSLAAIILFRHKNTKEKNILLKAKNKEINRQVELLKASNKDLVKYTEIISHDLREPLRNLSGFTHLLNRELKDFNITEDAEEYMGFIKNAAVQMGNTLDGISDYSKIGSTSLTKSDIDLNNLIKKVINDLHPLVNASKAKFEISNLPNIFFNSEYIYQIFFNLISNAINFRSERRPIIKIDCQILEDTFLFSVNDNGVGIPEEFHDKIFILFQRLQNRKKYSGAGLGLPTCKKIIELSKGEIFLESTVGVGSTFFFKLPKSSSIKETRKLEEVFI